MVKAASLFSQLLRRFLRTDLTM